MNDAGLGYGDADSFTTSDSVGTVTDIDGNVYKTIKIGTQWWMAENLKVTHYCNGDSIPNVTDNTAWYSLSMGGYCNYNNDTVNVSVYGKLYNWYAVNDSNIIAPAGWHVPTDAEWKQMEMYIGMSQAQADSTGWRGIDEGGKMKETGTVHWDDPNNGATNVSGFSGLPAGFRYYLGDYNLMGTYTSFWTFTAFNDGFAWTHSLAAGNAEVARDSDFKGDGFSVRCVKD